ncbi:MAG TPA: hypothetical protein VH302_03380, partial [Bryobacteraceae bacterium]|nr:hypothetical protein [Bryobacteraceae bacterium]
MITNYNTSQAAKLWRVELLKGYSSPCCVELMLQKLLVFDGVGDFVASDGNDFETEHRIYHGTRCWNTRSRASEPAVDATYRTNALVSRAKREVEPYDMGYRYSILR